MTLSVLFAMFSTCVAYILPTATGTTAHTTAATKTTKSTTHSTTSHTSSTTAHTSAHHPPKEKGKKPTVASTGNVFSASSFTPPKHSKNYK
jgi:hypothetical protein